MMIIYNISASIMDACIDSISIQQARKDQEMGQKLFSSFQITWFVIGALSGSIIVITINNPFIAFQIGATAGLIITIGACVLSDDVEYNE
jgi:hypothetical protein